MADLEKKMKSIQRTSDTTMTEPIKVECTMTYLDFRKFTLFSLFKKGKHLSLISVLLIITLAFVAFVVLLAFFAWLGGDKSIGPLLLCPIVIVLIFAAYFLLINVRIKRNYRNTKMYATSVEKFSFNQDSMQIETTGESLTGNAEYKYNSLYRVCEVKDTFYIYFAPTMAYAVQKRDMDNSSRDALAALLKTKLGNKYIVCF